MANLNCVMLIGRLTRDPEVRQTPNGSVVADFGIAVNRVWYDKSEQKQEETTFVDITCWARTAELAGQYLAKGRQVFVDGRLKLDQWDDKTTGQKRSKLTVVAENVQFLDRAEQQDSQDRYEPPVNQPQTANAGHGDDIPF